MNTLILYETNINGKKREKNVNKKASILFLLKMLL